MYVPICVHVHVGVCINMGMIFSMYMSIYAHACSYYEILIIHLTSTYIHGFMFKPYTPLSTFSASQFGHTFYQLLSLPYN